MCKIVLCGGMKCFLGKLRAGSNEQEIKSLSYLCSPVEDAWPLSNIMGSWNLSKNLSQAIFLAIFIPNLINKTMYFRILYCTDLSAFHISDTSFWFGHIHRAIEKKYQGVSPWDFSSAVATKWKRCFSGGLPRDAVAYLSTRETFPVAAASWKMAYFPLSFLAKDNQAMLPNINRGKVCNLLLLPVLFSEHQNLSPLLLSYFLVK